MELLEFLRARLDEDERVARAVPEAPWEVRGDPNSHGDVISAPRDQQHGRDEIVLSDVWRDGLPEYATRFDPARVLAEVDAKRRIIDEHPETPAYYALREHCARCVDPEGGGPDPDAEYPCKTLRLLALPYANHPDYDPSWAPTAS